MISFKQYLKEDPLDDVEIEMALCKELKIDHAMATMVLKWLKSRSDIISMDMQVEIYRLVSNFFERLRRKKGMEEKYPNDLSFFDLMSHFLFQKYGITLSDGDE